MKEFNKIITNTIIEQANFERKPASFKDVKTNLLEGFECFILELIETLPVFTFKQLGIKTPLDDIKTNEIDFPKLFVLEGQGNRYLINTAGFKYCRYVILID